MLQNKRNKNFPNVYSTRAVRLEDRGGRSCSSGKTAQNRKVRCCCEAVAQIEQLLPVLVHGPDLVLSASFNFHCPQTQRLLMTSQQLALLSSLYVCPFLMSVTFLSFLPLFCLPHTFILFDFQIFKFLFLQLSTSPFLFPPFLSSLSCSASVLPLLFFIHSLPFPGAPLHWMHLLEE